MIELPTDAETAAAVRELREQIKARQARPSGPDAAVGALNVGLIALRQRADEVNDMWVVNANLPMAWPAPGTGTVRTFLKKAVRSLLRWYIDPIVEQQNRFNNAAVRALVELCAYQEYLTRQWELLDERVQKLTDGQGATDQERR